MSRLVIEKGKVRLELDQALNPPFVALEVVEDEQPAGWAVVDTARTALEKGRPIFRRAETEEEAKRLLAAAQDRGVLPEQEGS